VVVGLLVVGASVSTTTISSNVSKKQNKSHGLFPSWEGLGVGSFMLVGLIKSSAS